MPLITGAMTEYAKVITTTTVIPGQIVPQAPMPRFAYFKSQIDLGVLPRMNSLT